MGFGRFLWRIGDIVSGGLRADFGEGRLCGRREGCDETGGQFGFGDEGAVEFDFVELASVAAAGVSSHGRSDPDGGVVDDGSILRWSGHVPSAFDGFSVDKCFDALWISEGVGDRDVVPAVVVAESGGGGPPVPLHFAAFGGGREEQARAVQTVGFAEAECPVLIVRSGGFGIGSTFSDEVDVLALVGGVRSDPGFEGEGIAVFEIEDAIGTRVVNDDSGSVAGERDGAIGLSEAGVLGAPRAGDTGANVA